MMKIVKTVELDVLWVCVCDTKGRRHNEGAEVRFRHKLQLSMQIKITY